MPSPIARPKQRLTCRDAAAPHRSSQCRRPQHHQELRADCELLCVIRSARDRLPAQQPATSSSTCDLWSWLLPVWSLSAIRRASRSTLANRVLKSWMGLSPSRHSVNTVSVRISNSVPCGLGRPPWSPTPWSPLARALLHRAAPYSEGAGGCALHRPAQARCTSGTGCTQQQAGLVAPCFKVLHRAYPWARARKRSPSHGIRRAWGAAHTGPGTRFFRTRIRDGCHQ